MKNVIAMFEYGEKKYIIKLVEKTVLFIKLDANGNETDKLSQEETIIVNEVWDQLQVNPQTSILVGTRKVGTNKYSIYFDKVTRNHFWISDNNLYNDDDNIKLNFKYNFEPSYVYNDMNDSLPSKPRKMFQMFKPVGGKLVAVLVTASILLSTLSACAKPNVALADTESPYSQSESIATEEQTPQEPNNIKIDLSTLQEPNEPEHSKEYNSDDIKNIIKNNPNLSSEEKEFFLKLIFVFDEYHDYMDLDCVKERLTTIRLESSPDSPIDKAAYYDYRDNKIVLFCGKNINTVDIGTLLHELFHGLQQPIDEHHPNGYGYFMCELSNSWFTREILIRMYKEGIIEKERFLSQECKERYITGDLTINDELDWLWYADKEVFNKSGYRKYIKIYDILVQIIPREALLEYQFYPSKLYILIDELSKIYGNFNEATNLIDAINDLREYDPDIGYIYHCDDGTILKALERIFELANAQTIPENVLASTYIYESYCYSFRPFFGKGFDSVIIDTFLTTKGVSLFSSAMIEKTILSDAIEKTIIICDDGEELTTVTIDDKFQGEYELYLQGLEQSPSNKR